MMCCVHEKGGCEVSKMMCCVHEKGGCEVSKLYLQDYVKGKNKSIDTSIASEQIV